MNNCLGPAYLAAARTTPESHDLAEQSSNPTASFPPPRSPRCPPSRGCFRKINSCIFNSWILLHFLMALCLRMTWTFRFGQRIRYGFVRSALKKAIHLTSPSTSPAFTATSLWPGAFPLLPLFGERISCCIFIASTTSQPLPRFDGRLRRSPESARLSAGIGGRTAAAFHLQRSMPPAAPRTRGRLSSRHTPLVWCAGSACRRPAAQRESVATRFQQNAECVRRS